MDEILSISEIIERTAIVRNLKKGYITNFFLDKHKHHIWIQRQILYYELIGDTLFLIKKEENYWNLFYCSASFEELGNSFEKFKQQFMFQRIIIDIVGTDEQCAKAKGFFFDKGFRNYCSLVRMSRITPQESHFCLSNNIYYSNVEESSEILRLLFNYFNPKSEQIPLLEELQLYAKQNQIILYKEESNILGFIIYEVNKSTLYLRYWFVDPASRDKGIGSKLINKFFAEGNETKRQLFWVITSNENAITKYQHYGFKKENLYNHVITNF